MSKPRWRCPKCKKPTVEAGYLGWRDCTACGWEERLPTMLIEVTEENDDVRR